MRFAYNILFYLLLPFILLRLFLRSRKTREYRTRIAERLGFFNYTPKNQSSLWIHAVSFGEAKVAIALINALKPNYPIVTFVVTTMTITGSKFIQEQNDPQIFHIFVPYDFPGAIKRFLYKVKPRLAIIIETELWPNILYYCGKNNIPIVIANARLSAKSTQGYARIRWLIKPLLKNVSMLLAQTETDAKRFNQIGIEEKNIKIAGNIKFDITPPAEQIDAGKQLRQTFGATRPIWIAASTHSGEEQIILEAQKIIQQQFRNALLILVPRHPERFEEVAMLCRTQQFKITRRSQHTVRDPMDIFLADSMGELWAFYAAADIAFVGGSFVAKGGHNLLEPATLSLPILTGPSLFNFAEISQLLLNNNALTIVKNATELAQQVIHLLQNKSLREQQGKNAFTVVQENLGALQKYVELIKGIS